MLALIKFLKRNKYLVLVTLLAALLRFVAISDVPPALNWDEVSHGYNAYSILKTGRDEWEYILPTIFRAYGDYKLPVYIYLIVVSEFFFGVSEFAVRLPSVLAGITTVIFTYFLVKELLKNRLQATLAALLVAVEPWSFFLSRGAFEANLALALFVIGAYFFLKGLSNHKFLPLNSFFFGLSVWTYNSYRIFTPLFILILVLLFRNNLLKIYKSNKLVILKSIFIILFFLIPMFYQLLNSEGRARYGKIEILDNGAIAQIDEDRNAGCPRLYCNKATFFTKRFIRNYFSHFTPGFLFLGGGTHYQFSVPGSGLIYPVNAIFLMLGLVYVLKRRDHSSWVLLAWVLLAPIPDSLTREVPHVLRTITLLPVPMVLSSLGLLISYNWVRSKFTIHYAGNFFFAIYLITLFGFTESYLNNYFTDYKRNYSWSWQYGYKETVSFVKENYDKYDKVIITKKYGEPHEFVLFYWPWNPKFYQSDPNLNRFYQSNWYWVDGFDKFYFVNDWQVADRQNEFVLESQKVVECQNIKCLLVTSPGNYLGGWRLLETVKFLDGKPAFEIYEN